MAIASEHLPGRAGTPGATDAAPVSLESVRSLLRGLNREQRRAVTHREGPLLVLAGPGTGKTEVITRRVAWLIATKRARPSEILALTFTDKAAQQMQARVDLLVPYGQADAAVHTFHAFGDRLIRDHAFELGMPPAPRVIDRAEAIVLLREHLFELGLRRYLPLGDPTRFLGALVDHVARAKDQGIDPVAYRERVERLRLAGAAAGGDDAEALRATADAQEELAGAYATYQRLLGERGLLDHGDQVSLALRLLATDAIARRDVRERFRYVVVDESQDTNPAQLELVRLVAGERANVTVVGDDDQSIYRFRGAAMENLLGFDAAFPGHRTIVLRRNYRSYPPILDAARRLIRHNDPARLEVRAAMDKTLVPHRRAARAEPVRQLVHRSPLDEAEAVASEIRERVDAGARPSDFAILVRTNADAEAYGRSLEVHGVAWRSETRARLFDRPEVRELLAFLRTVADPGSTLDVYALATSSPYGLGGPDLSALLESARRRHRPLWDVLVEMRSQPGIVRVGAATRERAARLVSDVEAAIGRAHARPAGTVLYEHLKRSGILARLVRGDRAGDDERLAAVGRLFEIVRAQGALLRDDRVPFLVRHLDTLAEAGGDRAESDPFDDTDAVAVLTVHKAKGLEFRHVFLVGLVEGRFPTRQRRDPLPPPPPDDPLGSAEPDEASWAEERRLFYVAMTRARDSLVLSYPASDGAGRTRRPSPFIAEALDRPATTPEVPRATALPEVLGRFAAPADGEAGAAPREEAADRPLSLSFSQVDAYLACPLRYKLRHVVGVPTPPHHALVVGNAMHQAVAAFHQSQARGRTLDETALLEILDAHWTSEGFLSREHEEARYAAAREALTRFRSDELARGSVAPAAVERPFSFALGADVVRGRYDRVDETPDGTVITDYKSSHVRDPEKAAQKARDSLQLQMYALAHEAETGELPVAVRLHFLETGVVGRVAPDRRRLDRARAKVAEAADGIRAGRFRARPDLVTCSMCPYRSICAVAKA